MECCGKGPHKIASVEFSRSSNSPVPSDFDSAASGCDFPSLLQDHQGSLELGSNISQNPWIVDDPTAFAILIKVERVVTTGFVFTIPLPQPPHN